MPPFFLPTSSRPRKLLTGGLKAFLTLIVWPAFSLAQQPTVAPPAGTLAKGAEGIYGPVLCAAVETLDADGKAKTLALRGMLVRLGEGWLCYDMDLPGPVAVWPKPSLDLRKTNLGTYKGVESGAIVITGESRQFPAPSPGQWRGAYLHGDQVIAAVERGGTTTYELLGETPRTLSAAEAATLTKGGPARWPKPVVVQGKVSADDAAYVVDTVPLPEENPWKAWTRPTGLDFFSDGRMALASLGGDIWIVSGLDGKLNQVSWRRYATGLREPMGLRIVDGKVVVGCRDQITRLHDLNGDGEADFYECVNAGRKLVPNFHAFAYDLQTDRAGNFYFGTGGNQLGPEEPWHGQLYRVSGDGKTLEAIAKGLRAPNGLTIGPDDAIYVAENQGQWIPSSKISRVRPGGYYGFVADPKNFPKAKAPESFDPPLCYIPMTWDNSSGGGAFCESDRWGPFRGRMIHTSFGAAALFAVFEQRVGESSQAAVVKFPLKPFDSGIHRARFGPHDGQLYVCGIKGWQSKAVRDGNLARVRYTGKPAPMPIGYEVKKGAVVIQFAEPLDRGAASDPQNYAGEQWNYLWHGTYGSPDVPPSNPKRKGRDPVDIQAASLSSDGRTVTLSIPDLQPVMQMLIKANLRTAKGEELPIEIAGTINAIP